MHVKLEFDETLYILGQFSLKQFIISNNKYTLKVHLKYLTILNSINHSNLHTQSNMGRFKMVSILMKKPTLTTKNEKETLVECIANKRKYEGGREKFQSEQRCHNHYRRPRGEIGFYQFDP